MMIPKMMLRRMTITRKKNEVSYIILYGVSLAPHWGAFIISPTPAPFLKLLCIRRINNKK